MGTRQARARVRLVTGAVHEYDLTRRRSWNRGGASGQTEARSRVRVEVVAANGAGALLTWTIVAAEPPEAPVHPLASAVHELTRSLAFRYRTSATGRFRRLVDLRALRRQLAPVVERLGAALPEDLRPLLRATTSETAFTAHCLRDAPLLHGAFGLTCPAGGETFRPVVVQSPLEGSPLDATERITHEPGDRRDVFRVERLFEPEVLRSSLLQQLGAMAARVGRPAPGRDDVREALVVDRGRFELEQPGGWPLAIALERESFITSSTGTAGQGETVTLSRV